VDKKLFDKYRDDFNRDGFVMMKDAISKTQLEAMRSTLNHWVDDSRNFSDNFGEQMDGRPRFDVEPNTHSKSNPALRRVASPIEVSDTYLDVTRDNAALDLIAHIFNPNIKLVGTKINLKLPGSGTVVKYHQDFPFEPHSNDDIMTTLYFLDDVTLENGPLEVVPGSHKKDIYSLWHNGVFTGAVDEEVEERARKNAVKCTGKAGDACLMHTRVLHGSLPNKTNVPRCLYIATYASEDSIALDRNHLPSKYDGEIVRGRRTGTVRASSYHMEMPEYPEEASFFNQQSKTVA
jgi:phytanoyl-CoA hydroxylase